MRCRAKKGTGLVIALLICITLFCGTVSLAKAESNFNVSDAGLFTCGADGVITMYNGSKDNTEIIVPAAINGIRVTGIGDNVFAGFDKLITIGLPASLASFGNAAFSGCTALNTMFVYDDSSSPAQVVLKDNDRGSITLPDNLSSMGAGVFAGCKAVSRFAVAESNPYFKAVSWQVDTNNQNQNDTEEPVIVRNRGEMLCSKDQTVLYRFAPAFHYTGQGLYPLPAGLTTISAYACEGAGLNGGFQIPATVTAIGDYAFYSCNNLNTMEFIADSHVASIGAYAFAYNNNLNITLPASVNTIGIYSFAYCVNIQINIAATALTAIPEYAFYECDNLHSLDTPVTLKSIEAYAFYGCNNLNTVTFQGATLDKIGTGAFQTCNNLHEIVIPSGVTTIENSTFDGCQNLNKIILPDTVTTIGDNAFKDCQNIHEMVIPKNVKYISSTSFAGAKTDEIDTSKNAYSQKFIKGALPKAGESFTVGNLTYKVVKSHATKGTVSVSKAVSKKLTSVTIAKTVLYKGYTFKVTAVDDNAFKGMKKLKKVTIGANVTKLGKNAFYNAKKLKQIKVDSTKLKSVGKNAIKGIQKKAVIKVPKKQLKKYKKLFKKGKTGYKNSMKVVKR